MGCGNLISRLILGGTEMEKQTEVWKKERRRTLCKVATNCCPMDNIP